MTESKVSVFSVSIDDMPILDTGTMKKFSRRNIRKG